MFTSLSSGFLPWHMISLTHYQLLNLGNNSYNIRWHYIKNKYNYVSETFQVHFESLCVFYESDNFHQKWQIILQTNTENGPTLVLTDDKSRNIITKTLFVQLKCDEALLKSCIYLMFSLILCLNNSWKPTYLV